MSGRSRSTRPPENWQPGQDYWIYLPTHLSDFLPARRSLIPRGRTRDPWLLIEERLREVPDRGLTSFTPPAPSRPAPVPLLVIDDAYSGTRPDSPPTYYQPWADTRSTEEESRLSPDEQKQAISKLRKQLYSPHITNIFRRLGNRSSSSSNNSSSTGGTYQDDVGKRCAVCLEDFVTRQFVTTTPCNHMFHEECIVPWVKSQGKCPVCRYVIAEKTPTQQSRNDFPSRRGGIARSLMF